MMSQYKVLGAALAATCLTPMPALAETSTEVASVQEQLRLAQQQIAQLQAQLDRLQAQVNAQQDSQARTDANASAATSTAEQALALAKSTQQQASRPATVPDSLKWAAETRLSGRMYFNVSHVSHKVNGSKTGNSDNGGGYNIKRFYFGVDHRFDDTFSANLTTDVSAISGVGQSLYIKKAYLQAALSPAFVVQVGSADLPWIPYVESIYGYRHIEQTVSDRTKFGTSADWGVHVKGELAEGLINYQLSAIDGAGYRDPRFSHTIDFEGRVSAKFSDFHVAVGGYYGKLGRNVQGSAPLRNYQRINALVAYQGKIAKLPVTLGAEYFHSKNKAFNTSSPILSSSSPDSADGYSIFASVAPFEKWSVFARHDVTDPSNELNSALRNRYSNVGIQYTPAKIINMALVYKRERAHSGAFSTSSLQSGVIGCSTVAVLVCSGSGSYDEFGLYGQFRF